MQIAIIGGGIGGLAAAIALERAGHEPVVYERQAPEAALDQQGVFLTLAINGQVALAALGAGEQARALGFATGGIRFASGRGKVLGALPIGPRLDDGTTARTVRRTQLLALLTQLAEARGIRIEQGRELVGVTELSNGVELNFADGSTARADLLVGADGLSSRVRRLVHPGARSPRYTGVLNTGGFARVAGVDWDGGDYWMTWGHRCFFGHTVAPDGEVWWFANPPEPTEPPRGSLRERTPEQIRASLLELLADDAGPAARIVAATEGSLQLWAQHDLPSIPRWTTARTVLLGDAAHAVSPTTGQGASLALEDAVILARCLAADGQGSSPARAVLATRSGGAVSEALAAYEAARRARVEKIAAWGRRTGNTKTAGPIARRITDLMMPPMLKLAGSASAQRRQAWIHDFDPTAHQA
ncbi:MAG: FAD-dependent monooxygenase [Solirubrobacteraceae bacterium]|nr:FAD-dependent monooxygenase [Solirubrobacteraceae bacterium]